MGLSLFIAPQHRLNSVVGINLPEGIDGPALLHYMSSHYKVEISGSFGANIVRIGQMGEQCRAHQIFRTLHALGASLTGLGVDVDVPAGVSALEKSLQEFDRQTQLTASPQVAPAPVRSVAASSL
jgi:aspartate aminotransferase-like enzyme